MGQHPNSTSTSNLTELRVVIKSKYKDWIEKRDDSTISWMKELDISSTKFPSTKLLRMPVVGVQVVSFLFVDDSVKQTKKYDKVWSSLKTNSTYVLKAFDNDELGADLTTRLMTSYALSSYKFSTFKSTRGKPCAKIVWPLSSRRQEVVSLVNAYTIMKDLVNLPALQMGPKDMERVVRDLSIGWGAEVNSVVGVQNLLDSNYPQVVHSLSLQSNLKISYV